MFSANFSPKILEEIARLAARDVFNIGPDVRNDISDEMWINVIDGYWPGPLVPPAELERKRAHIKEQLTTARSNLREASQSWDCYMGPCFAEPPVNASFFPAGLPRSSQ